MRFQGLANVVVRGLLRTPLICRVVGTRLVTIYVVGRTSGTHYAIPTAYTGDGSTLLIGTSFRWARNLRTGDPVDIRFLGRRRIADVEVVADEAAVVACYDTIVRGNHQFARFNHIRVDAAGNPLQADLHQAWAAGARAIRLTPR
jgi:hypothetical protein